MAPLPRLPAWLLHCWRPIPTELPGLQWRPAATLRNRYAPNGLRTGKHAPGGCGVMTTFVPSIHCFDPILRDRVRDANPIDQVINGALVAAGHRPLMGSGVEFEGWHPPHGSQSGTSLKVNSAK